jgi:hypothetical protein
MGSAHFMRLSFKKGAHAALSNGNVQEIRGISLVFREMWDTTNLEIGNVRPKRAVSSPEFAVERSN